MKTNIELAQEAGFMLDDASRLYTNDKDGDCHEQIHNLIDLVRVEAQPVIPPAFKQVPRSPTLKMLEAGEACYNRKDPRDSAKCIAVHVFRSMYDAAPTCQETADAHLIADLLEAIEELLAWGSDPNTPHGKIALEHAEAAIAKATKE